MVVALIFREIACFMVSEFWIESYNNGSAENILYMITSFIVDNWLKICNLYNAIVMPPMNPYKIILKSTSL